MKPVHFIPLLLLGIASSLPAQQTVPSLDGFADGIHHWNLEHKERLYPRLQPTQYREIADRLMAYQNSDGGWPKNIDWLAVLPVDSVKAALRERYRHSTLDNRNTFPQIEYLADVYSLTHDERCREAACRGLEYLLGTQKANGGWRGWDVDAITFNDEVTTGALELFLRIGKGDSSFSWIAPELRQRIAEALQRGIRMVLDCQVVQQGVKTAWGQQHDNVTLRPVAARTFELASLTARESCSVIQFLMEIPHPSAEVIASVDAAVAWLRRVQLTGFRVEEVPLPEEQIINHEYPFDRVVVADPSAPPIWARFYEVDDNTPFLCTRAGQKVWRLADVNAERRTGYDWYGYWPVEVLQRYEEWKRQVTP